MSRMRMFVLPLDASKPDTPEREARVKLEMRRFKLLRVGDRLRLKGDARGKRSPTAARLTYLAGKSELVEVRYGAYAAQSDLGSGRATLLVARDGEDTVLYCAPADRPVRSMRPPR